MGHQEQNKGKKSNIILVTLIILLIFIAHESFVLVAIVGVDNIKNGDGSELSEYAKDYNSTYTNIYRESRSINASNNIVLGKIHFIVEYTNITKKIVFSFKVETVSFFRNTPFNKFTLLEIQARENTNKSPLGELLKTFEISHEYTDFDKIPPLALTNWAILENVTDFIIRFSLHDNRDFQFFPKPVNFSLTNFNQNVSITSVLSPYNLYRLPDNLEATFIIIFFLIILLIYLTYITVLRLLKNPKIKENEKILQWKTRVEIGIYYIGYLVVFNYAWINLIAYIQLIQPFTKILVIVLLLFFAYILYSRCKLRSLDEVMGNTDAEKFFANYSNANEELKKQIAKAEEEKQLFKKCPYAKEKSDEKVELTPEEIKECRKKAKEEYIKNYNKAKEEFKSTEFKETLTAIFSVLILIYFFYGLEFVKILSFSL